MFSVYLEEQRKFFIDFLSLGHFYLGMLVKYLILKSIFQLMYKKIWYLFKRKGKHKRCPESVETLDLQRSSSAGPV